MHGGHVELVLGRKDGQQQAPRAVALVLTLPMKQHEACEQQLEQGRSEEVHEVLTRCSCIRDRR